MSVAAMMNGKREPEQQDRNIFQRHFGATGQRHFVNHITLPGTDPTMARNECQLYLAIASSFIINGKDGETCGTHCGNEKCFSEGF
jgi:hypothetical protein